MRTWTRRCAVTSSPCHLRMCVHVPPDKPVCVSPSLLVVPNLWARRVRARGGRAPCGFLLLPVALVGSCITVLVAKSGEGGGGGGGGGMQRIQLACPPSQWYHE